MGLPGVTDSAVYDGLKDVLQRQPEITAVEYEPDSISKRFVRATIDPNRVTPTTGPQSPTLEVEWRYADGDAYYRIHYADPNTGFNCGWHRDEDHPELGPVHFQYERPETGESDHTSAHFSKSVPAEVLWEAIERLFDDRLPALDTE
ncbi:hypothetical protein [Natrononativus amylolyticus]|uniref:hypothetical protein n=1 Tax=Natrononativus amylolyticus TaxID=2963434 RepID=UPI0020CBD36E|nr:hypothetical protein [Natrononativus amylolyticus]